MTMNSEFNSKRYSGVYAINNADKIRINIALDLIGHNKNVMDIGCGNGFVSDMLMSRGNTVEGIETSESSAAIAKQKGMRVYNFDLSEKECPPDLCNRYDAVFAGEVLEHIFDTDTFLSNVYKMLRRNGVIVVTTPNVASLGRRLLLLVGMNPLLETTARAADAGHVRYFTHDTLRKLLEENKFEIEVSCSDCINFNRDGRISSVFLSKVLPRLGRTIIFRARKR